MMNLNTILLLIYMIEVADTALYCKETVVRTRSLGPCVIFDIFDCSKVATNGEPSSLCVKKVELTRYCTRLSSCVIGDSDGGSGAKTSKNSLDMGGSGGAGGEDGGQVIGGGVGGHGTRGSGTGTNKSGGPVGVGNVVGGRSHSDLVGMPKKLNSTSINAMPGGEEAETGGKWRIGAIVVGVMLLIGILIIALTCKMRRNKEVVAAPLVEDGNWVEMEVVGADDNQPDDSQGGRKISSQGGRKISRPRPIQIISNYNLRSNSRS